MNRIVSDKVDYSPKLTTKTTKKPKTIFSETRKNTKNPKILPQKYDIKKYFLQEYILYSVKNNLPLQLL